MSVHSSFFTVWVMLIGNFSDELHYENSDQSDFAHDDDDDDVYSDDGRACG